MKRSAAILILSIAAGCSPWAKGVPGAPYAVQSSDAGVRAAAEHVLEEQGLGTDRANIADATVQVVSGTVYTFRLELADRTSYRAKVYRGHDGEMTTELFEKQ